MRKTILSWPSFTMKKPKFCFCILKCFSVFLCSGLFFYLMINIWQKYSGKMTSMGSSYQENKSLSKLLPCVTICPRSAYKNRKFSFDNLNFISNSYQKEEIFSNMMEMNNKSLYHFEEIRGVYIGCCYMFCYMKEVTELDQLIVNLKKNKDVIGKNNFLFWCVMKRKELTLNQPFHIFSICSISLKILFELFYGVLMPTSVRI